MAFVLTGVLNLSNPKQSYQTDFSMGSNCKKPLKEYNKMITELKQEVAKLEKQMEELDKKADCVLEQVCSFFSLKPF